MSGFGKVNDEFVQMVAKVRAHQVRYFKLATGEIPATTSSEMQRELGLCKKAEKELDQWIELYQAEKKRWEGWVAAHDNPEPLEGDKPTHTHTLTLL